MFLVLLQKLRVWLQGSTGSLAILNQNAGAMGCLH